MNQRTSGNTALCICKRKYHRKCQNDKIGVEDNYIITEVLLRDVIIIYYLFYIVHNLCIKTWIKTKIFILDIYCFLHKEKFF